MLIGSRKKKKKNLPETILLSFHFRKRLKLTHKKEKTGEKERVGMAREIGYKGGGQG